jgi:hypothetical protein
MPYATGGVAMHQYEDLLVDVLLDRGFTVDEALHLIALQERIERERREEEERLRFVEWMTRICNTSG